MVIKLYIYDHLQGLVHNVARGAVFGGHIRVTEIGLLAAPELTASM